jgi:hypothetical protein
VRDADGGTDGGSDGGNGSDVDDPFDDRPATLCSPTAAGLGLSWAVLLGGLLAGLSLARNRSRRHD